MGFATTAIHAGQEPDSATGAVTVPIYQTSTYAQEGLGKHKGFEYARTSNPTRLALERNIAALEGAKFGYAFASGMAAIDATLRLIKANEHVIVSDNTYGGTFRLFNRILSNYCVEFDFVDTSDVANVEADGNGLESSVRRCPYCGRARSLRQHVHVALSAKAAGIRRRYSRALNDKIPEWPFRWRRWRRSHEQ